MAKTFGVPLNDNVTYQLKYRKMALTDENGAQDILRSSFLNNQKFQLLELEKESLCSVVSFFDFA